MITCRLFVWQAYFYCSSCNGAWSDDKDVDCHPAHSGEFVSFPGIDIISEFVTEAEEQFLCDSIDAGRWIASQSGRYKQVVDVTNFGFANWALSFCLFYC